MPRIDLWLRVCFGQQHSAQPAGESAPLRVAERRDVGDSDPPRTVDLNDCPATASVGGAFSLSADHFPAPGPRPPAPPDPDAEPIRLLDASRFIDMLRRCPERPPISLRSPSGFTPSRIRPVSGKLLQKAGRQEFSPTLGMSLGDPFYTKYLVGLRYAYHVGEQWSVGVGGFWAEGSPSGAVTRCDSRGLNCRTPSSRDLLRAPGNFNFLAGVDLS